MLMSGVIIFASYIRHLQSMVRMRRKIPLIRHGHPIPFIRNLVKGMLNAGCTEFEQFYRGVGKKMPFKGILRSHFPTLGMKTFPQIQQKVSDAQWDDCG